MSNRLIDETSPYLLQHANNPVDWYPWGPEALQRARAEDKPILLSIGYSACHWCHVMERESFENEDIALLMNERFINIKVDREERPDLDAVYMEAVQMLTGSGGWPMTVFLTPDTRPFYGGTYFPPEDRHNMPGFARLLSSISDTYRNKPDEIERVSSQLAGQMGGQNPKGNDLLSEDIMHQAYTTLAANFDNQNGGTGTAPKFPQPMTLEFLLRYHQRGYPDRSQQALKMVELTLEKMAYGGIYDQIGGGFHRYSTDAVWLVPHFEKMLYDNALLTRLYLHAFQVTQRPLFRRITEETLDYVLREMTDPVGGFYSAQDADSEGEEGKFFMWTPNQTRQVLGDETVELVGSFLGLSEAGNFEGKTIFNIPQPPEQFAEQYGIPLEQLLDTVQSAKHKLRQAREKRVKPMRDDKQLSSWNGLMLHSFAEAARVLGRADYLDAAVKNADFLISTMFQDGRMLRTCRHGKAKLLAYLEDYAFVADGLLTLYEASFQPHWLEQTIELADAMIDLFWDDEAGAFYDTGKDHENLVVRPRDSFDNAQPCGGSVASGLLLRLAVITGNEEYSNKAVMPLRNLQQQMARAPMGAGHWLGALDFYLSQPSEIAIIGPRDDLATGRLLATVFGAFLPNKVVVGTESSAPDAVPDNPLLEGRKMLDGKPTAYVCQNYVCQLPVTEPLKLAQQLGV